MTDSCKRPYAQSPQIRSHDSAKAAAHRNRRREEFTANRMGLRRVCRNLPASGWAGGRKNRASSEDVAEAIREKRFQGE